MTYAGVDSDVPDLRRTVGYTVAPEVHSPTPIPVMYRARALTAGAAVTVAPCVWLCLGS